MLKFQFDANQNIVGSFTMFMLMKLVFLFVFCNPYGSFIKKFGCMIRRRK